MAEAWEPGRFRMLVRGGDGPLPIEVDGLIREPFALDERENRTFYPRLRGKGFCITHLPTGYAVRTMVCSREKAMKIADALLAEADWQFTSPEEGRERGKAVGRVMDRFGRKLFVSQDDLGPAVEVAGGEA